MSEVTPESNLKRKADNEQESSSKKTKNIKKEQVPQMQGNPNVKRKVAVLIAYNGKGYHGIQRNPPFPSIEEEILKALLEVKAITQEQYDKPSLVSTQVSFQRAARTDKHVSAARFKRTTKGFDCKTQCTGRTYMYVLPTYALAPVEMTVTDNYRVTGPNFTKLEWMCGKPFVREGLEFVTCKVRGQSFMLHHIRKMIGLMIAVVKGYCKEDAIELSWGSEKVDVPKAPGLGLLLDELYFDGYNKKWGRDGLHEPIEWSEFEEELEKFREEYILPEIYKGEKNERVMWDWLKTLHMHSFDVESKNRRRNKYSIPGSEESTRDVNEESQNTNLDLTDGDTGGEVITTNRTEVEANPQTVLSHPKEDGEVKKQDFTKSDEVLKGECEIGHKDLEVGEGQEGDGQDRINSVGSQSL
uniref:tRNA pseudouridine synthase A n=1 Tax=Magallana gigas TaxID=29159 RepID=K1QM92_MAGGI